MPDAKASARRSLPDYIQGCLLCRFLTEGEPGDRDHHDQHRRKREYRVVGDCGTHSGGTIVEPTVDGRLAQADPSVKPHRTNPVPRGARARARVEAGNQRPWPADKVERWAIERLIPYAKNARTHTDAQVAAIAASI